MSSADGRVYVRDDADPPLNDDEYYNRLVLEPADDSYVMKVTGEDGVARMVIPRGHTNGNYLRLG